VRAEIQVQLFTLNLAEGIFHQVFTCTGKDPTC